MAFKNKFEEKHMQFFSEPELYYDYMDSLIHRVTDSNFYIEKLDNFDMIKLINNTKAFKKLLALLDEPEERILTEELIIDIANTINKDSMYISDGYRKIGKTLEDIVPISLPENIEREMKELLDDYYGPWSKLDVFEREARFNIRFLGIHPFEDGNGRTSRLLLNFNLLRQGYAPVVIPKKIKNKYFDARNKEDVKWIQNMFERLSEKELDQIDMLIDNYIEKNKGITPEM